MNQTKYLPLRNTSLHNLPTCRSMAPLSQPPCGVHKDLYHQLEKNSATLSHITYYLIKFTLKCKMTRHYKLCGIICIPKLIKFKAATRVHILATSIPRMAPTKSPHCITSEQGQMSPTRKENKTTQIMYS